MGDSSQVATAPDNGGSSPASSSDIPDGSTLDTTLLESLFYNEMMMLDDSSVLLSTLTGGGDMQPTSEADKDDHRASKGGTTDPLTMAEQSLLRDFGVSEDSMVPHTRDDSKESGPQKEQYDKSEQKEQHHHHQQQPPASDQHQQQQQQHPSHHPSWQQHYYQDQNYNPYQHQQGQPPYYAYPPHPPPPAKEGEAPAPHPPYYSHPYAHHPPPGQQHQAPSAVPPPSAPQLQQSRGIKHSVTPKYETSKYDQTGTPASAASTTIPYPLAPQHPQHAPPPAPQPVHHYYHGSHPPPTQPYPQHHHHQYPPHPPPPPPAGNAPPTLVPVPAPSPSPAVHPHPPPGHHDHSAYGPSGAVLPPQYPPPPPPPPAAAPASVHPAPVAHPHSHSHSQPPKQQLVSQFATLANRLGINLPSDLLKSLTEAGAVSASGEAAGNGLLTAANVAKRDDPAKTKGSQKMNNGTKQSTKQQPLETTLSRSASIASSTSSGAAAQHDSTQSFADALRRTAEEAVAAVARKRSADDGYKPSNNGNVSDSSNKQPSYAKRRKKPRLSDCESRLEKLREENELLKKHLDNVTNQTQRFDEERVKSEETMRRMLASEGVSDDELNEVISEYTEMYSDYGKRRHQELSFHLEQLQKLANPTNFTKMGLWTIAKANGSKDSSKQNPLIGILQKELNINSQQTRKILDQRAKIRDLCSNLNASLFLLQKLKDYCEQKNKTFNDRMNKTKEILTPKQVVKLIMFVKDYSDVLGSVCPGWTSEQIVQKKKTASAPNATTKPAEVSSSAAAPKLPPEETASS